MIYIQSSDSVRGEFTSRLTAILLTSSTEADLQRDRKNSWSTYKHLNHRSGRLQCDLALTVRTANHSRRSIKRPRSEKGGCSIQRCPYRLENHTYSSTLVKLSVLQEDTAELNLHNLVKNVSDSIEQEVLLTPLK